MKKYGWVVLAIAFAGFGYMRLRDAGFSQLEGSVPQLAPVDKAGVVSSESAPVADQPRAAASSTGEVAANGATSNSEVISTRGNFVVRRCDDCESGVVVEDPYDDLPLDALQQLAIQDPDAAFKAAIRLDEMSSQIEGVEKQAMEEQADRLALRSVALSSQEDIKWYFEGATEHLDLYQRSSWDSIETNKLLRAYKWLEAGRQLGLMDDSVVQALYEEMLARGLGIQQAQQAAERHAADLRSLRLSLTGLPISE